MSATLERQAEASLSTASMVEAAFRVIEQDRREARVRFIRDAKAADWSWRRMGCALGISDAAVRRFWRDNRMAATRLGGEHEGDAMDATEAGAGADGGAGQAPGEDDRAASSRGSAAEVHDGERGQSGGTARL